MLDMCNNVLPANSSAKIIKKNQTSFSRVMSDRKCRPATFFTARRYAGAVLGVVILSIDREFEFYEFFSFLKI